MMAARTRLLVRLVPSVEHCPYSSSKPFRPLQNPFIRRALPLRQARTFTISRIYKQQQPPPPSHNDPLPPPPPGSIPPNLYFPQEPVPAPAPTSIFVGTPPPPHPGWNRARVYLWLKRGFVWTLYILTFAGAYLGGLELTSKFFPFDSLEPETAEDFEFCNMIADWLDTNPWIMPHLKRVQETNDKMGDGKWIASVAEDNVLNDNPFLLLEPQPFITEVLKGSRALPGSRATSFIRLPTNIPCDANYGLYPCGRFETFWLGSALTGWPGKVHGGAIATTMQHSMQKAVLYACNSPFLPISPSWGGAALFRYDVSDPVFFQIDYLKPIDAGNIYTVFSMITRVSPSGEIAQTEIPMLFSPTSTTLEFEDFVISALKTASAEQGKPFKPAPPHYNVPKETGATCLMFPSSGVSNFIDDDPTTQISRAQVDLRAELAKGLSPDLRGRYAVTAMIYTEGEDDSPESRVVYANAVAVFDVVDFDKDKRGGTLTAQGFQDKVALIQARTRELEIESGGTDPRLRRKAEMDEGEKKGKGWWGRWF